MKRIGPGVYILVDFIEFENIAAVMVLGNVYF